MPTDEELWAALECVRAPEPKPEWKMTATRGRNLIGVGWSDGILRCAFAGQAYGVRAFYRYKGVPEAEYLKLTRSPFPDRLFTTNIRSKYAVEKEA